MATHIAKFSLGLGDDPVNHEGKVLPALYDGTATNLLAEVIEVKGDVPSSNGSCADDVTVMANVRSEDVGAGKGIASHCSCDRSPLC